MPWKAALKHNPSAQYHAPRRLTTTSTPARETSTPEAGEGFPRGRRKRRDQSRLPTAIGRIPRCKTPTLFRQDRRRNGSDGDSISSDVVLGGGGEYCLKKIERTNDAFKLQKR